MFFIDWLFANSSDLRSWPEIWTFVFQSTAHFDSIYLHLVKSTTEPLSATFVLYVPLYFTYQLTYFTFALVVLFRTPVPQIKFVHIYALFTYLLVHFPLFQRETLSLKNHMLYHYLQAAAKHKRNGFLYNWKQKLSFTKTLFPRSPCKYRFRSHIVTKQKEENEIRNHSQGRLEHKQNKLFIWNKKSSFHRLISVCLTLLTNTE